MQILIQIYIFKLELFCEIKNQILINIVFFFSENLLKEKSIISSFYIAEKLSINEYREKQKKINYIIFKTELSKLNLTIYLFSILKIKIKF